jgi:hypothetical protein
MQFMNAQHPPIWPDGNAWLICMDVLHLENIIRPVIFNAPVGAEPEPAVEEKNPFAWSDYNGSDYAKWERQKLVRDFDAEHTAVFRAGLTAAAAELGGIELSREDVRLVREKCNGLAFHEWTPERIKNVALATFGGPTAVPRDPEDVLSSTEYLQTHRLGTSVMREGK